MSKIEEKTYYHIITQSLGNLCETNSTISELKEPGIFGAAIFERTQNSTDHFIWRSFHLYNNGKWDDIKLSGYTFSKIASVEHYNHFYKGVHNKIKIHGLKPDQCEFIFEQYEISGYTDLVNIVFAMVVISESNSLEIATNIWNVLSTPSKTTNPNTCLNEIELLMDFSHKCFNKYKFLDKVIQTKIKERFQVIRQVLSSE